ncbi:YkoP family protein [Proteiniclasticum sp. C24MP]|uniref:YkoP family protein n=1 Tax=Proteiniclasticum sp. C24MP TaxID=3374101 RepID=UPI00375401D2
MKIFSRIIATYDKNIVNLQGWKKVPGSTLEFLYMVPKKYKGKPVRIKDGTVIREGDSYYEIHIINTNLAKLDTSYGNLFIMLNEELRLIGEHMKKDEGEEYKAVLAVTLLHRLARRAGFTIKEIDSPVMRRLVSLGENILRTALRKEKDAGPKKKRVAKECWMSRDQVMSIETEQQ